MLGRCRARSAITDLQQSRSLERGVGQARSVIPCHPTCAFRGRSSASARPTRAGPHGLHGVWMLRARPLSERGPQTGVGRSRARPTRARTRPAQLPVSGGWWCQGPGLKDLPAHGHAAVPCTLRRRQSRLVRPKASGAALRRVPSARLSTTHSQMCIFNQSNHPASPSSSLCLPQASPDRYPRP